MGPTVTSRYPQHQQRVIDELNELLDKLRRLRAFITDKRGIFKDLPMRSRAMMDHQEQTMSEYAAILAERIADFPQPTKGTTMTEDQSTEQAIIEAGANTAPRVTPSEAEANIVSEWYLNAGDAMPFNNGDQPPVPRDSPLRLVTMCFLVLKNGFTVHGTGACASAANYNEAIGRRIARENAVREIWPLMGYALRSKLATESK